MAVSQELQARNKTPVEGDISKQDSGSQGETPELSLVDFCTQLDDYTPTVSLYIRHLVYIIYIYIYYISVRRVRA